jgi:hypothetical protein
LHRHVLDDFFVRCSACHRLYGSGAHGRQVATISLELEVASGVIVTKVVPGDGYTLDVRRVDGRIVAITWKREIPPHGVARFMFVARNPQAAEVAWKAKQRFADGTSADWVGVQGDRRPAAVTRLTPGG